MYEEDLPFRVYPGYPRGATVWFSSNQIKFPQVLKKGSSGNVTEGEAGQGVKEALTQGVLNAVLNLNKTDGFFGSNVYKMFLPEDAQK